MNYNETLSYLYTQLPMFQRIGKAAYKADLGNTIALDNYFGHPHQYFKSIHVAGTNGKGSTSHMLAAILQTAGYKVGLYTSPHLSDYRERIRINGKMIPEDTVIQFVSQHRSFIDKLKPSFFELTVAMAFDYFANEKVDIAVIEVGLGGRLDSTNIISPLLGIITNIGMDHTDLLGNSLTKIASEKAGIIKPNTPIVISQTQPDVSQVFISKALGNNAPIYFADKEYLVTQQQSKANGLQGFTILNQDRQLHFEVDLQGRYQRFNLPSVLKAVELLKTMGYAISEQSITDALSNTQKLTGLMGRWQNIGKNPLIYCDTGHNVDGIRQVVEQIALTPHENLHMVIGTVADKNIDGMLSLLPQEATYYFTQASIPRALNYLELKQKAQTFGLQGEAYPTVLSALSAAKAAAQPNDLIFVGGSTFVVAEVI